MKSRKKYIILILATAILALLYYNHRNALTETSFDPIELKIAKIFFGIGIIATVLYLLKTDWKNLYFRITMLVFGISLILNLYMIVQIYETVQMNKRFAEYTELETCEEMEQRFTKDLKNGEIKYFQFGIGFDKELEKTLKRKYNIESFGMGCIIQSEMECYNILVNNFLKEKYNERIIDY